MRTSVKNICRLLSSSKLLNGPEVQVLYERWQKEGGSDVGDPQQFCNWLVCKKKVSPYQAQLLVQGHGTFFVNQYKILDRIGKGRVACVFKAAHWVGQVVAIKVLPRSKMNDPEVLARFRREAKLARKLKHPNVVRTFEHQETPDGLHFMVLEYLVGETLEEVLVRKRKLLPLDAAGIVHQALLGLQHVHEHGMVHRDLKPGNLMLVPSPTEFNEHIVKLLDIGLGRALIKDAADAGASDADLTQRGQMIGTPEYMAPEQARDPHAADIRADVYSLGCVLYHALAGQPPFVEKNTFKLLRRHATERPRPLTDFDPCLPDSLQDVVSRMLAKHPSDRFATPAEAAQALVSFLTGPAGAGALPSPDATSGGLVRALPGDAALSDHELLWKYLALIEKDE